MTDHPHAKLLEEAREAAFEAWRKGDGIPETWLLNPTSVTAFARHCFFAALETAPPTASLVEAGTLSEAVLWEVDKALKSGGDIWAGPISVVALGILTSWAREALTAHPAADAPPLGRGERPMKTEDLLAALEPAAEAALSPEHAALCSIAISLKRIADALEPRNEFGETPFEAIGGGIARSLRR